MKKTLLSVAFVLPLAFAASQASALPGYPHSPAISHAASSDIVEVKGGRGKGHGWGKYHGFKRQGWSRGRKSGGAAVAALPDFGNKAAAENNTAARR